MSFEPIRVVRRTQETELAASIRPREGDAPSLPLPNRLLSHFLDHFARAAALTLELERESWPGSWRFDHVLCEDVGQLVGRGVRAIHDELAARDGVPGRGHAVAAMDDAEAELALSLEGRPSAAWSVPPGASIDGFVDAWYDEAGTMTGQGHGTNLRQFLDGFAYGSDATLSIVVRRCGNLHHVWETVFRALGDATASALGRTGERLPGDTSGLAGACRYDVERAGASRR